MVVLFQEVSVAELIAIFAVFLVGGALKGAMGFGLPLVTMALLPLFIPVQLALAINAVVLPLANVAQFFGAGLVLPTITRFWPVLAGLMIGVPIGAVLVSTINESMLLIVLGIIVILFSVFTAATPRYALPEGRERPIGVGIGVAAGTIGTLTTANGAVFIMYLLGLNISRQWFVSCLGLFFVVSGALISGFFWAFGILNWDRLVLALTCLAPTLAGMYVGDAGSRHLSGDGFKKLILVCLCILGANLVLRGMS